MLTLPGLIDPHVHLRGLPSDDYKEDFYTATSAAIAGGFTTIIDMPNNPKTPTLSFELLKEKQLIAKSKIVCDVGFNFGTNGQNLEEFQEAEQGSIGLKVFLSFSTANLVIDILTFEKVCNVWTTTLPILLHAEENTIEQALEITEKTGHRVHICHVSSEFELQQIIDAKMKGFQVTCGVTPHHLFLTREDEQKLGVFARMKPSLKTPADVDFLWKHLPDIDLIESDHAPHSREEKESVNPPFGVTALETTLPLLLTAASAGKLTIEDIRRLCHDNAAKIFKTEETKESHETKGTKGEQKSTFDSSSYIEIDENEEWTVDQEKLFTKAKMSPFHGWKMKGKVKRVFIRGTKVYEEGKILVKPGFGKILKSIV